MSPTPDRDWTMKKTEYIIRKFNNSLSCLMTSAYVSERHNIDFSIAETDADVDDLRQTVRRRGT